MSWRFLQVQRNERGGNRGLSRIHGNGADGDISLQCTGRLRNASWPGRYEVIEQPAKPRIILDGAHTPASARALAESIRDEDPRNRRIVVLGMMADKDPQTFVSELDSIAQSIVATASRSPTSSPWRSP